VITTTTEEENCEAMKLIKKLTGTPDQSIYPDGTTAPVLSYNERLISPVMGEVTTVKPYDPATGKAHMPTRLVGAAGDLAQVDLLGNSPGNSIPGLVVKAQLNYYNNVATALEVARTPTVFKTTATATVGDTTLWDPAAGKKFRIMGFSWQIGSNATTATTCIVSLKDGSTGILSVFNMGTTTGADSGVIMFPGNGYLSTAADNILSITLTAALTAGQIMFNVWGTEE
jgi:hypothetical protein